MTHDYGRHGQALSTVVSRHSSPDTCPRQCLSWTDASLFLSLLISFSYGRSSITAEASDAVHPKMWTTRHYPNQVEVKIYRGEGDTTLCQMVVPVWHQIATIFDHVHKNMALGTKYAIYVWPVFDENLTIFPCDCHVTSCKRITKPGMTSD